MWAKIPSPEPAHRRTLTRLTNLVPPSGRALPCRAHRWRATIALRGVAVSLELEQDGKVLPSSLLYPGSYFHDEVIELAPLTSPADWRRWFETVLVGHFSRGEIPHCPESASRGSPP